jgi:hypothetical protein
MDNPTIKIVDTKNGTETITDMSSEELAQWKSEKTAQEAKFAAQEAAATSKAALLDRLGITADEAALLLS